MQGLHEQIHACYLRPNAKYHQAVKIKMQVLCVQDKCMNDEFLAFVTQPTFWHI